MKMRIEVYAKRSGPYLIGEIVNRHPRIDSGVVDDDVQSAKACVDFPVQNGSNCQLRRHPRSVRANDHPVWPRFRSTPPGLPGRSSPPLQPHGDLLADAFAGACDEGNPSRVRFFQDLLLHVTPSRISLRSDEDSRPICTPSRQHPLGIIPRGRDPGSEIRLPFPSVMQKDVRMASLRRL